MVWYVVVKIEIVNIILLYKGKGWYKNREELSELEI